MILGSQSLNIENDIEDSPVIRFECQSKKSLKVSKEKHFESAPYRVSNYV